MIVVRTLLNSWVVVLASSPRAAKRCVRRSSSSSNSSCRSRGIPPSGITYSVESSRRGENSGADRRGASVPATRLAGLADRQNPPGATRLLALRPLREAVVLPRRQLLTRYVFVICVIPWYRRIRLADWRASG